MNTKRSISFFLIVLMLALAILACSLGGSAEPEVEAPTAPPPTEAAVEPTTPPEPTPEPAASLGDEYSSEEGGYAFLTIPDFEVTEFMGFTSMIAPDDENVMVAVMGSINEESMDLEQLYAEATSDFDEGIELSDKWEVLVDGVPGLAFDLSGTEDDIEMAGRIIVVAVTPEHGVQIIGAAPHDRWEAEIEPLFEAVVASLSFFEPVPVDFGENELPVVSGELGIDTIQSYQDHYDDWYVVGLLTNYTERAVDGVEIEIEVFDSGGNSILTEIAYPELYTIAPGETVPFSLSFYEDLPDDVDFVATIVGYSAAEVERPMVEIRGTLMTIDDDGDVHVTGEIVNNDLEPISIDVAAATFDSLGEIVTADSRDVVVGYLDPGESGPFRVSMTGIGDSAVDIMDYTVYLDAEITSPTEVWTLDWSEDESLYLDSWDWFHLVGEVTNTSVDNLNIRIVAGLYDAAGNVLDAASTDLPLSALAPGETVPYDFGFWGPVNYAAGMFDQVDTYTLQWDPSWTWTTSTEYVDLSTANDEYTNDDSSATFTGQVVNNTDGPVSYTYVIAGLRDIATGVIVGMEYDSIWDEIPAGGSAEYDITIEFEPGLDVNALEYFIIVKGELP
ncbi:MAG: FxLYD domain-containing protein [Chloroflexi bacterium]|nr:FxLYD domain-containing protein [Chloroflexota bacterium]